MFKKKKKKKFTFLNENYEDLVLINIEIKQYSYNKEKHIQVVYKKQLLFKILIFKEERFRCQKKLEEIGKNWRKLKKNWRKFDDIFDNLIDMNRNMN